LSGPGDVNPRGTRSGGKALRRLGLDLDLARLGRLGHRDPHGQHAVLISGLDRGGVDRVTEPDPARERAGRPLADVWLLALGQLLVPRGADGENTAVHGDVEAVGVDARQVEAQHQAALGAGGVHRHTRRGARAERGPGRAERPLDPAVKSLVKGSKVVSNMKLASRWQCGLIAESEITAFSNYR